MSTHVSQNNLECAYRLCVFQGLVWTVESDAKTPVYGHATLIHFRYQRNGRFRKRINVHVA